MKIINFGVLVLLPFLTIYCSGQNDEELVGQSFEAYKSAILNDKGEQAVKYVDSLTIAYYSKLLEIVKYGDSITVDALPILGKIIVLTVRAQVAKNKIISLDGKGLFVFAIKNGMISKSSVSTLTVGDVAVDSGFAKMQIVHNGKVSPLYLYFHKEQNQWKVDLTSLFPSFSPIMKKQVSESGKTENDFCIWTIESTTGIKTGPEIWKKEIDK